MHRTQSEEPPKSPFLVNQQPRSILQINNPATLEDFSRTSSRQSHITTQSDVFSFDSRNDSRQSQFSGQSETSRVSFDHASYLRDEHTNLQSKQSEMVANGHAYTTSSLPRKSTCVHHHFNINHHKFIHNTNDFTINKSGSLPRRASSCASTTLTKKLQRRNSFAVELIKHNVIKRQQSILATDEKEQCSTCSSSDAENDGDGEDEGGSQEENEDIDEEKEILIDFKPRLSPAIDRQGKKKLLKTKSDGEILIEMKKTEKEEPVSRVSASEEDLKTPKVKNINFSYSNTPIKDEGICHQLSPREQARDAFRKRSISLEDASLDNDLQKPMVLVVQSAPPTPPLEDLPLPEYPSMDSLTTTSTKEHSDNYHWNESQTTILT